MVEMKKTTDTWRWAVRRCAWIVAVAAAPSVSISICIAQAQPTLDELLDIEISKPEYSESQPADQSPSSQSQPVGHADALRELSDDEPAADVFEQAIKEMQHAADQLGNEHDPGLATQRMQESILAKLDQVIAAAQQQGQSSSSSGSSGSSQSQQQQGTGSAQNSAQQQGGQSSGTAASSGSQGGGSPTGGQPSSTNISPTMENTSRERWGDLPPRLRQELLQGLNERFSSVYEQLTRDYYRRLAEQEE